MPDDDLTTEIPPPHETDGPQQPVDDSKLEEETHPTVPAQGPGGWDEGRAANLYMRAG